MCYFVTIKNKGKLLMEFFSRNTKKKYLQINWIMNNVYIYKQLFDDGFI